MEFRIMENFMRGMKLRLVALICIASRKFLTKRNKVEQERAVEVHSKSAQEAK